MTAWPEAISARLAALFRTEQQQAEERGAKEVGAWETGAGHSDRLDEPGARGVQGSSAGTQPALQPPGGARKAAGLGPEPGAVEGAGVGGVGERGRGALIYLQVGPPRTVTTALMKAAGQSLGLSPAMGHGDDGRAKDNPEASRGQDSREVDAAALATAQAQLAAAETAIERAAAQAAARFAEAERRIERAEERQRQREKQREEQLEKKLEKQRGKGAEFGPVRLVRSRSGTRPGE